MTLKEFSSLPGRHRGLHRPGRKRVRSVGRNARSRKLTDLREAVPRLFTSKFLTGRQPFAGNRALIGWRRKVRRMSGARNQAGQNLLDISIFPVVHVLLIAQSVAQKETTDCRVAAAPLAAAACFKNGWINSGGHPSRVRAPSFTVFFGTRPIQWSGSPSVPATRPSFEIRSTNFNRGTAPRGGLTRAKGESECRSTPNQEFFHHPRRKPRSFTRT